jgi:hypothetical protein
MMSAVPRVPLLNVVKAVKEQKAHLVKRRPRPKQLAHPQEHQRCAEGSLLPSMLLVELLQ